jgi:hypothetical protein
MKRSRLTHFLLSMLIGLMSLSGCRSVSPGVVDDAARALQQADDALRLAQQHADEASRATTLQKYLDEVAAANRAAQEAQDAAQRAKSYANQVDDPSLVRKAEDASSTSNSLLNRFIYQVEVDQISRNIIQENNLGSMDEHTEKILKDVLNVTFCYTISNEFIGQFPSAEQIRLEMLARSGQKGLDLANFETSLSRSIEAKAYALAASLQRQEDLQNYKDACENLMDLF